MITDILQQIQKELKAPKSQYQKFGGYNYRSCEDILEAVKPLLAKHNAAIVLGDNIIQVGERYYVEALAKLIVGEENITVRAFAREEETKKGMDGAQITGAASSYARKYALNGLFAIDDTKDADAMQKDDTQEIEAAKEAINNNVKIIAKAKGKTPDEVKAAAYQTLKLKSEPKTLNLLIKLNELLIKWVGQLEING